MSFKRAKRAEPSARRAPPKPATLPSLETVLPPLLAVVLAIPCFGFPWLWDDYAFLAHAQTFRPADLLPQPDVLFWRPISREIWFEFLWRIAPGAPVVAHVLHAVLVALSLFLLKGVASRLFGERAGFLAALLYASLGALPMLIGWASASQDLFAVLFFLTALRLRLSGRFGLSILAAALALLSKETIVFLLPILALTPSILGEPRPPRRSALEWGSYAALVAVWALVHPGIRTLVARRFTGGGSEVHVGIGGLDRLPLLGQGLLSLFNIPIPGATVLWSAGKTGLVFGAAVVILAGLYLVSRSAARPTIAAPRPATPSATPPAMKRAAWLAVSIALLPVLAIPALLKLWAPYYAALPGIGAAMLLGALLARAKPTAVAAATVVFMALGVVSRAQELDPMTPTEVNYVKPSAALARVEHGFRTLYPTFPKGSHLLVSVAGTGRLQIDTHLHYLQAPRVWYRDPSLRVLHPNARVAGERPEFLFRVTSGLDVVEIDPFEGRWRTTGEYLPDQSEIDRPIRTYARALGATGEVDRGVAAFLKLEQNHTGSDRVIDRRHAAMLLFAAGRSDEAAALLQGAREAPREIACLWIAKQYQEAVPDTLFEEAAYPAFGIDSSDLEARRAVLAILNDGKHPDATLRLARRIQALAPGDPESRALIEKILSLPPEDRIVAPVLGDSL